MVVRCVRDSVRVQRYMTLTVASETGRVRGARNQFLPISGCTVNAADMAKVVGEQDARDTTLGLTYPITEEG